jgi:two-component system chemotaxis sensor kinase CheA
VNRDDLAARLRATFAAELDDQLRAADAHLLALEAAPADAAELRSLFRVMHTLKGAARAAARTDAEQICHAAESALADVRDAGRPMSKVELNSLFSAVDALRALASGAPSAPSAPGAPKRTTDAPAADPNAPNDPNLASTAATATAPTQGAPAPTASPAARGDASVRVAADRLDALLSSSNRLLITSGRAATEARTLDDIRESIQQLAVSWRRHHRIVRQRLAAHPDTVELSRELDRLDGHLRQIAADATRIANAAADTSRTLVRVADDLSEGVRVLRLRPFDDAVDGVARMARDIAESSGKQVRVEMNGDGADADRGVLDLLREAILHLVRNAVDHGIESPSERRAGGKPEMGTIAVSAAVSGDRMRVTVSDDGRGLDVDAIRRELTRRGEDAIKTDRQLVERLLSGEGISTRSSAGAISGRGVGLGAANMAVQRARGSLSIEWATGRGTTFVIDTPLTLATIRAILARVGELTIACPASPVERLARVRAADVSVSEGRSALATPNGPALLVPLAAILGAQGFAEPQDAVVAMVLSDASSGGRSVALRVDELMSEGEVVVRPIRAQGERQARHISGAALLPDGNVALVLNVPAVLEDAVGRAETIAPTPRAAAPAKRRVLVVDDSITTRTLEQSVLEAAGYVVLTAVDGADGWRLLQERGADLVVADVEMPRMDGLELCRAVRASQRFRNLPFVLITALESPEHRAQGMEAGADAYLGKSSFEQAALVDVLRDLLGP